MSHILSVLTFIPLVGALTILLMDKRAAGMIKGWAFTVAVINFAASLPLWWRFARSSANRPQR